MLPETLDLLEGLKEMRNQRRTFALVLDEHGGVAGVISLRDILEQLVGDLSDEFDGDDEPEVQKVREGRWLVDGQIHVDRFNDELGVELPEGDYVTLAGFLLSRADEIPGEGDDILWGDWRFKVQSMDKRRISEVIVEQLPETAVEPEELP
jgi:CBS domain containing-hemolysin-like protein